MVYTLSFLSEIDPVGIVVVYSMISCTTTQQEIQGGGSLSYDLDYVILFWSWILSAFCENIRISWKYPHPVDLICILWIYPYFMDIIRILWKYPHSVDIIRISGKYPRSMDVIRILWIYPHFVYIICIDHIMSYLAHNIFHDIHSLFLVVYIIYIANISSYLACNVCSIFHIY